MNEPSLVAPNLYMGGLQQPGFELPLDVKHVVSLVAPTGLPAVKLDTFFMWPINDSPEVPAPPILFALAQLVNACRKTGGVLVHCSAGINRSGLVCGLALVLEGMPPEKAIETLREKRHPMALSNPAFEAFLMGMRVATIEVDPAKGKVQEFTIGADGKIQTEGTA